MILNQLNHQLNIVILKEILHTVECFAKYSFFPHVYLMEIFYIVRGFLC